MKAQPTNIKQAARLAVASAPSLAGLTAAVAKLESLRIQRDGISAEVAALEKQASSPDFPDRVQKFLNGDEKPSFVANEKVLQARLTLAAADDAIRIQEREVQSLLVRVSVEARNNLRSVRQELILRVAGALKELEAVAKEDVELVSAAGAAGASAALLGYIGTPDTSIFGGAEGWLSARRAEGYKV